MKFGLCASPQALGFPTSNFSYNLARLKDAGADFLEFGVSAVSPEGLASEFDELRDALQNAPLQVEAFNSFIPGHHRITGPAVKLASVLEYSRVALSRCRDLGAEIIVLGSAGARKYPENFDFALAEKQFIEFCRELAPIAQSENITICIEPLNAKDDNLIVSVEHGARLVDEVAHPNIQLLADLYHVELEGEPLSNIAAAGARLRHTHVADTGRVAPGFAAHGEADFKGFFSALQQAGYDGSTPAMRCSYEGAYTDIFEQAAPLLQFLRKRRQEAA